MPDFPPPHPPHQAVRPEKFRQRVPRTTTAQLAAAKPAAKVNLARHLLQPSPAKQSKESS